MDWWPECAAGDVRTVLLSRLAGPGRLPGDRPSRRRAQLGDAGMAILRASGRDGAGEIWCRCDGGPHGFLSIAAHGHADALAVEVRVEGIDVLADPGTYCYHGEPRWRSYFRSTAGHNTLELDGIDQSTSGGPFLWTRHADGRVLTVHADDTGLSLWRAEHEGYGRRRSPVVHRRTVELDAVSRELRIFDEVRSRRPHACRLSFHLGPDVGADLDGERATLSWPGPAGAGTAELVLAPELTWSAHRGELDPPLGWYSPGFGRRKPSTTLIGKGILAPGAGALATTLYFEPSTPLRRPPAP